MCGSLPDAHERPWADGKWSLVISSLSDRSQFSSLQECTYLNQASLGLIGQPAVTAMHEFIDKVGRHGNLHMTDADEVAFFSELRVPASRLLNCREDRLAIVSSAGEMLSQLPYLFRPRKGSTVLSVATDFPAVTRPWIAYAAEHGCSVGFVDETPSGDLTEDLIDRIDDRTSVVAVSNVQFSTGSLIDVPRLREATRRVGAALMIDVTQAAGAISIAAQSWDAEVVVCSGYKWLGGHGGVGLAVMAPKFLDQSPPAPGWMGAPDPFDFDATALRLAADARRYTQSTMSYVSMRGLTVAIDELLALGDEAVEAHARSLARLLLNGLDGSRWSPYGAQERILAAPHIVTLTRDDGDVGSTVDALRQANIVCGSRNGRIRVSIAHFCDENDIRAFLAVLTGAS